MQPHGLTTFAGAEITLEHDARGTMQRFDEELERLSQTVEQLAHRLAPITSQYATAEGKLADPRPEPKTQLLGRVERLADLTGQIQRMTADIDL